MLGVIDSIVDEALSYAYNQKISKVIVEYRVTYVELSDSYAGVTYTNLSGLRFGTRSKTYRQFKGNESRLYYTASQITLGC